VKDNREWSRVAAIMLCLPLCLGLCASGCQQSSENTNTSKVENTPVSSEIPVQKAEPTQTPTPTATPVPVQRKDVRIIGLMIGTGIASNNKITNPTSKYHASDSIYALVRTSGTGPEATIKLECKDKAGNVVFEESKKITPQGEAAMVFTLTAANHFGPGEYHLMGLLDNYPTMAVSFEVSAK
jgi:hypothetical protein